MSYYIYYVTYILKHLLYNWIYYSIRKIKNTKLLGLRKTVPRLNMIPARNKLSCPCSSLHNFLSSLRSKNLETFNCVKFMGLILYLYFSCRNPDACEFVYIYPFKDLFARLRSIYVMYIHIQNNKFRKENLPRFEGESYINSQTESLLRHRIENKTK